MLDYITAPVQPHHRAMLEAAAGDRFRICYQEDGRDYLTEAEIIIGETTPQDLLRAQNLQWFHLVWAGADRYKSHFFPAGALFTNGSGAYGAYIAEHVIGSILCLYRQLRHYEALQKAHIWDQKWQETTLEGKTVLILGTGDLGGSLAKRLQGFDCRVLGICRSGQQQPGFHAMHTLDDLDRLLPLVDVVVGCLPSTPETSVTVDGSLFTPEMCQQLETVFSRLERPLQLTLYLDERPVSAELKRFMTELTGMTDKLTMQVAERSASSQEAPCVRVCLQDGTPTRLAFHGVPGGHEFTSFVLGLYNAAGPGQALDDATRQAIAALNKPVNMKVLVSLSCTMCPDLVVAAQHIAALNPQVTAEVYDLAHFEQLKERYQVMSVPCLVLNGDQVTFGKKNIQQLLALLS